MRVERRITRGDGRAYSADGDAEQAAAILSRGRAVLAEARAAYALGRRDTFTAVRLRGGTVAIGNLRRAAPLPAADELAEARMRLIAAKAATLGGPR